MPASTTTAVFSFGALSTDGQGGADFLLCKNLARTLTSKRSSVQSVGAEDEFSGIIDLVK